MNRKLPLVPYAVWAAVFIALPTALIVAYAFTERGGGWRLTVDNAARFFQPVYLRVLGRSLAIAAISTIVCLFIGYPAAMAINGMGPRARELLLLLLVVPMWMNLLLRTYAFMTLLENSGLINRVVRFLGGKPIQFLYNDGAVVFGSVYNFLPFMILPIYSALEKIDARYIEASRDLGANPAQTFFRTILPMSMPGVISGCTMVFMPALTNFVIPRLLGGGQYTLIGSLIEQQFIVINDWNFGSAAAIILMAFVLLGARCASIGATSARRQK